MFDKLRQKRFRFYRQLDCMDCGPTCLRMVAAYYGRKVPVQQLREDTSITRMGGSLLGLSDAAEKIGLRSTASMPTFEYFCKEIKLPCIVHWNQNHFVVVYKIEKQRKGKHVFYVADPGFGLIKYDEDRFRKCWCSTITGEHERGIAMVFTPMPKFYQEKQENTRKSTGTNIKDFLKYIHPYRRLLINLFVSLLAGCIIQIFFPVMTQAIVDYGIGGQNIDFIWLILIAQLVLTISSTVVDLIRRWILLHISTRVNVSLIADFLLKMMKLPMRFFDSKLIGDLIQRIGDHSRVEAFLTQTMVSSLFSVFSIIVFSIALIIYSIKIFLIILIASFAYWGWIMLFMKKREELDHKNFSANATYQSDLIELIEGMQEIKLTGSEQQKRWRWEGLQAQIFGIKMQSLSLSQWQSAGSVFINETKNILITILSATAVVNGDITLGAMLSIQYIIGQINGPINQLVSIAQQLQGVRISLERLGEILDKDEEERTDRRYSPVKKENENIVFDHVDFTYGSPRSRLVLKDLCLTIPAGKTTAIVGLSGSGKTTMVKLMLGFYPPLRGKILLGGVPLYDHSLREWRACCGAVMQDGFIFSDTIAANIATGFTHIDTLRLQEAAHFANLDEFVKKLPLKYDTIVGDSGIGLSQGQKQRLLIARVIYKNPQYVFLDEATNALDTCNEHQIMENLYTFLQGKTVIIVAHRLSTVCNADNIVVLSEGNIVEQGTHQELLSINGAYCKLVKNQLQIPA